MLISLNWIRDFVDLPGNVDPRALAERFTVTTAEVEGVEQVGDDWIIEIDNKSITHRPDLWGHYGIAREIAAMYGLPLKPYPVTPLDELMDKNLPQVPIVIDDLAKSPRYSALRFSGAKARPSPPWMQARLTHVGLRPIDILVDLTNYIMAELGQPMHAFDAKGIDRIEVAAAQPGEKFATLDGVQRTMPPGALMIQSNRRSIAIAGVMGGADTEITSATMDLLLESANFEPATIRRCAAALGLRTDASARFEKSLDPNNTVLAIQRFVHLARPELPDLRLTSRLSDAFPSPPRPVSIRIDPKFVSSYVGREVAAGQIEKILTALAFKVRPDGNKLEATVPSFRATKDIGIEADITEEVARFVGYSSIEPALPIVTIRYTKPDAMHRLERETLELLCRGMSYAEIHRYIWFDDNWLSTLGYDHGATIKLRNPAAAGQERLRTTLIPGLLAAIDLNRRHLDRFELLEIGSVFQSAIRNSQSAIPDNEERHLALAVVAPGRKPAHEDELLRRLKTDLETWAFQSFGQGLSYAAADAAAPWEHEAKTATVQLKPDGVPLGRITVVPVAAKRRIDEHLIAWSIAVAELNLSAVVDVAPAARKLAPVPPHPRIDLDFSVMSPADRRYMEIERELAGYDHPLLHRLAFVDSYEGGAVPAGMRSFTFRATIADPNRTLTDEDIQQFRASFIAFLQGRGLTLRT